MIYKRSEELANLYPNFLKVGEDGILEMYCDNQMLSSFRKCQGYFQESYLSNPGHTLVSKKKEWSLQFGGFVHKCMEYFNLAQRDNWEGTFPFVRPDKTIVDVNQDYGNFMQIVIHLWKKYSLEDFKDTKQHKALGGMAGAVQLFTQYFKVHYRAERLRYIAWEVSFGRNKEVPIADHSPFFRAYLTGRIDNIVDTGNVIGPMDIKTKAFFDGTEGNMFKPHEGMEGYVYAWQQMIPEEVKKIGRMCNSMIINHISIQAPANMHERFKRSEKPFTPEELQEWKRRQDATFFAIYEILHGRTPTWNTELCAMWYFKRECPFKELHEVPPAFRQNLIKLNYQTKEAWTEERANGE